MKHLEMFMIICHGHSAKGDNGRVILVNNVKKNRYDGGLIGGSPVVETHTEGAR